MLKFIDHKGVQGNGRKEKVVMRKTAEEYIVKNLLMRRERAILDRLKEAGYEGYFVGGCIRDILIAEKHGLCGNKAEEKDQVLAEEAEGNIAGAEDQPAMEARRPVALTGDIDVATNALPQQVQEVFSSYQVVLTGLKHGTVTVVLSAEGASQQSEPPQAEDLNPCAKNQVTWTADLRSAPSQSASSQPELPQPAGSCAQFIPVEVTTYRSDGIYSDGRHPDSVKFLASIEEDLARRDFTMNAMACDASGNLVDCFGGREDIRAKIIRAVGEPEKRFQEDALRIMRALRFAAVLGFAIERKTENAIFQNKHLLQGVSAERIFTELNKLLVGKYAGDVVRRYVDVLGVVIPELLPMKGFEQHNSYHRYDVLEHCVRAMELVRVTPENAGYMKLAALFHDVGKPGTYSMDDKGIGHFYGHPKRSEELVRAVLLRLKADKRTLERVAGLVKHHDLLFERDARLLKKWMNRLTPEVLLEILEIKLADNLATGNMSAELEEKFADIRQMIEEILAQEQCFSQKDLAVSGSDVLAAGIKQGPAVGAALGELLDAVIEGACENERGALLGYLKELQEKRR